MPRLLQYERERADGMFQAGMTQTEIANHFNCSRMTIYRLLVRVRATGTTSDRRMICQVFRLHRRRARAH
jgi:transposase